jgi:hypothetical protein
MLPEQISGEHTVTIVADLASSSYLLNFSSEIDVVHKKCSLRQGLVCQGHLESSRSLEEHIKE